jgi:hypothetical protein
VARHDQRNTLPNPVRAGGGTSSDVMPGAVDQIKMMQDFFSRKVKHMKDISQEQRACFSP